jgi:hypothetical protein
MAIRCMRSFSQPKPALLMGEACRPMDQLVEFFLKLDKIYYTAEANLSLKVLASVHAQPTVIRRETHEH